MSNYETSKQPTPPPAGKSGCGCFLGGCLGVVIVCLLLCGGGTIAVYIFRDSLWEFGKDYAVDAASSITEEVVNDSEMTPEDKQAVNEQVRRVARAYKADELTNEQVIGILEELAQSPLLVVGMVYAIEQKYVVRSGLSEEERTAAHRTLERTARGVYEDKIDQKQLDPALDYIGGKDSEGNYTLKDRVTDQELRAFLAECKRIADEAEIPDEPFEVNIGEEIKKAIDAELGE